MKLINIFKQTLKEASNIKELSPLTRNVAAFAAANKFDSEKTSNLEKTKRSDQYNTFTELPKNLKTKGEVLASDIRNYLFPNSNAKIMQYELKKAIPSAQFAKHGDSPSITFRVRMQGDVRNNSGDFSKKEHLVGYTIYKDKFVENQDNPKFDRNLSSKLLTFFKELQKELQ